MTKLAPAVDLLEGVKLSAHRIAMPNCAVFTSLFRTSPGLLMSQAQRELVDAALTPGELPDDYRLPVYMLRHESPDVAYKLVQVQGKWLDQSDLDVWLKMLDALRSGAVSPAETGYKLEFSGYSMLKSLSRATGGSDLIWLRQSLRRLAMAKLRLTLPSGDVITINPVDTLLELATDGVFGVCLNARCVKLFQDDGWTGVDFAQRLALKNQLAKWLHAEFSMHGKPFARTPEHFAPLCGRKDSRPEDFVGAVEKALRAVSKVTGWRCEIAQKGKAKGKITCDKSPRSAKQEAILALDRELVATKAERARLDDLLMVCQASMTKEQLLRAEWLLLSARSTEAVRGADGTLDPVRVRELHLEAALFAAGKPAQFPDLRAHVETAQASLSLTPTVLAV